MIFKKYQPKHLKEEKTHRKFPLAALLSYLLVATVLTTGVSFSRYTTTVSGSDSARVAKWEVTVKDFTVSTIELSESAPERTHTFTIDNQSEVSVRCTVRVRFPSAPTAGIALKLGTQTLNTDGTNTEFVFTGAPIELGCAQSQSVTLTVAADSFTNAIDIDGIAVLVDAEQVD